MIILESEWNEAAGVDVPDGEGTEGCARDVPPSYIDITSDHAESTTSLPSGTPSLPSVTGRNSSGSRNQSSVHIDPPPSASRSSMSVPTSATSERFPGNSSDSARTGPVIYTFNHVDNSYNSMSLRSQTAMIPLYHVAVRMNCFIPSSYITVVTRGDEYGEEVGQFEMGLSLRKGTVTMAGREKLIEAVLSKGGTRLTRTWQWRFDNDQTKHLSWTFDSPIKYCYLGTRNISNAIMLATFTPPPLTPRADGRPSPLVALKMYPEGHRLFDHILISALILERRRLSPNI